MTKSQWSRAVTVAGASLVALSLVLGLTPSPAGSATQQEFTARAEAKALTVSLAGNDLLLGSARTADSTRTPVEQGDTSGDLLALPLLGDLLAAGVAAQEVAVDDAGNSAACAGLVGPGGQLQISAETPPECTEVINDPNGLILNLTGLGLVRLRADAVYASCTANAFGGADSDVKVANLAIDIGTDLGLFTVWTPAIRFDGPVEQEDLVIPALSPLSGLVDLVLNDVPDTPEPGVAETTALRLSVLGLIGADPLVEVAIGHVRCGANTVSTGTIDFDTSGSLFGDAVQNQTENAVAMSYTPDADRGNVILTARLDPDVVADTGRGLPADCSVSIDGTTDPTVPVEVVICQVGAVDAGETVQRVIPVEIQDDAGPTVQATLNVFGASLSDLLMGPVLEEEDVRVEVTGVSGDAGGLAVPSPNRTGLPNDIDGTLYLDVPDYVEEAAYGGTPCVPEVFDPPATVYPAVPGNVTFNCGSAIAQALPDSEPALAFTYADDAPETAGTPDPGRVVIIRELDGFAPQEIAGNSYYSVLEFFVDEAVVPPTSTSTSTTEPPVTSSSTTEPPASSSTTEPPASSSTTEPPATSSSTTEPPASSSTTEPPATSSTVDSTSSSRASTSTTSRPLARTGTDTRTTMSIALGLLGAGMVVTGRGMQAEVSILSRRRRS